VLGLRQGAFDRPEGGVGDGKKQPLPGLERVHALGPGRLGLFRFRLLGGRSRRLGRFLFLGRRGLAEAPEQVEDVVGAVGGSRFGLGFRRPGILGLLALRQLGRLLLGQPVFRQLVYQILVGALFLGRFFVPPRLFLGRRLSNLRLGRR